MRIILAALTLCLVTGCASTGYAPANRDYARNCGYAMDELLLCSGYVSPHTF